MSRTYVARRPAGVVIAFIAAACAADVIAPYAPEGAIRTAGAPPGWFAGSNSMPPSHSFGLDHTNKRSGSMSAYLTALGTQSDTGFGVIVQSIRADSYRGKRVRWSGWVAHKGLYQGLGGGLWMRVDGPGLILAFDNMLPTRALTGDANWHQAGVVLDVPANAIGIAFGVLLAGYGDLNADDLRLDVVDLSVPTTNILPQPVFSGQDSATTARYYAGLGKEPVNLGFESIAGLSDRTPAFARYHLVP